MISRIVTNVVKDFHDDITHLEGSWGSVAASDAREHIHREIVTYQVLNPDGEHVPITLRTGSTGTFLFANWDGTGLNNLDQIFR